MMATASEHNTATRAQHIPLQAIAAQAGKKLPAILDPDAVEEHDEADRSDERRRRRGRRDRAERQAGEQDRADVEREPRDRDPADGVAEADGRKNRQHRRLLEEMTNGLQHTPSSVNSA